MARIENVNTSKSEQTFAWFRKYAASFNEMRGNRHHFLVLLYCKKHNECLDAKCADYLNPYSYRNRIPTNKRRYKCHLE